MFKERYSLKQVHTKQRGRRADLHISDITAYDIDIQEFRNQVLKLAM